MELKSITQVARICDTSPQNINHHCKQGNLSTQTVGGRRFIDIDLPHNEQFMEKIKKPERTDKGVERGYRIKLEEN